MGAVDGGVCNAGRPWCWATGADAAKRGQSEEEEEEDEGGEKSVKALCCRHRVWLGWWVGMVERCSDAGAAMDCSRPSVT